MDPSLQQTRRKLEDVGKKLEILYDKLREHVVSARVSSSGQEGWCHCFGVGSSLVCARVPEGSLPQGSLAGCCGEGYYNNPAFVLILFLSFIPSLPRVESQLPEAVTLHLHVIKDCVYAYDYDGCLQNVNAMVSGGSFAMLADFLPGVKVLVQVAMQLGIYMGRQ